MILQGVMFGGLSLAAFAIGRASLGNIASAQTMAFIVLALSQVLHAYNMRSKHSIFHIGVFSNRKLNIAAVAAIVLIAVVVFSTGFYRIWPDISACSILSRSSRTFTRASSHNGAG